ADYTSHLDIAVTCRLIPLDTIESRGINKLTFCPRLIPHGKKARKFRSQSHVVTRARLPQPRSGKRERSALQSGRLLRLKRHHSGEIRDVASRSSRWALDCGQRSGVRFLASFVLSGAARIRLGWIASVATEKTGTTWRAQAG